MQYGRRRIGGNGHLLAQGVARSSFAVEEGQGDEIRAIGSVIHQGGVTGDDEIGTAVEGVAGVTLRQPLELNSHDAFA